METPGVVVERERVNSSSSFPLPAGRQARRHKLLFGLVVTIGVLLYAAFNVWVYQYSKGGKGTSPANLWQKVTKSGAGFGVLKGDSLPKQGVTFTGTVIPSVPSPTPTPTPHPTGPGPFACDPYGFCNAYEDAKRGGCPKTYADRTCLNECQNKEVRCPK